MKMNINNISVDFQARFNYTESVREMIEDGELNTIEEIEDYVKTCILEDIQMLVDKPFECKNNITINKDIDLIDSDRACEYCTEGYDIKDSDCNNPSMFCSGGCEESYHAEGGTKDKADS